MKIISSVAIVYKDEDEHEELKNRKTESLLKLWCLQS